MLDKLSYEVVVDVVTTPSAMVVAKRIVVASTLLAEKVDVAPVASSWLVVSSADLDEVEDATDGLEVENNVSPVPLLMLETVWKAAAVESELEIDGSGDTIYSDVVTVTVNLDADSSRMVVEDSNFASDDVDASKTVDEEMTDGTEVAKLELISRLLVWKEPCGDPRVDGRMPSDVDEAEVGEVVESPSLSVTLALRTERYISHLRSGNGSRRTVKTGM